MSDAWAFSEERLIVITDEDMTLIEIYSHIKEQYCDPDYLVNEFPFDYSPYSEAVYIKPGWRIMNGCHK